MAVAAFILINCEPGKEKGVFNALAKIPQIKGLRMVFGEYDLIARLEVKGFREVASLMVDKIRGLDGIQGTKTLLEA